MKLKSSVIQICFVSVCSSAESDFFSDNRLTAYRVDEEKK